MMGLQNLCTLFGPTLMKLSPKDNLQMDDMNREIRESMQQAQVLFYILQLHSEDKLIGDLLNDNDNSSSQEKTDNEFSSKSNENLTAAGAAAVATTSRPLPPAPLPNKQLNIDNNNNNLSNQSAAAGSAAADRVTAKLSMQTAL
jgi:hypothetical protein